MTDLPETIQRLLADLKRRHVSRVGLVYMVVAWIAIQVASVTFPTLHLPAWTLTLVVVLVLVGLPGYDVASAIHRDAELVDLPAEEQPGNDGP